MMIRKTKETTKKSTKRKKKQPLFVCSSYSVGPIAEIVSTSLHLKYSMSKTDYSKAKIIWIATQRDLLQYQPKPSQYLSKLHGSKDVCCKWNFSMLMNITKQLLPKKNTLFWPKTYLLPKQRTEFHEELHLNKNKKKNTKVTYILKPDDASQGDGITLVQKVKDIYHTTNKNLIAQKYLSKPMLIDELKFDLRIYVVITSLFPLKAYCCKEGLVRLATTPYVPPTKANLTKTTMHLTNYSLNKRTKEYDHGSATHNGVEKSVTTTSTPTTSNTFNDGNKRAMSATLSTILGNNYDNVWEKILQLVATTVETMHPMLVAGKREEECTKSVKSVGHFFQIFGFDVMLNDRSEPFLLEVNNNPSMSIDSVHPWTCNDHEYVNSKEEAKTSTATTTNTNTSSRNYAMKNRREDKRYNTLCRCMDSHEEHTHEISPVDVWIKKIVLRGALQLALRNDNNYMNDVSSCLNSNEVPQEPWYSTVPCQPMGGILSRMESTYCKLVGNRKKFDAYKWRKFVVTVTNGNTNKDNEPSMKRKERISNDIRLAEEMFRNIKMKTNAVYNCTNQSSTLLFIQLVCNWFTEIEKRKCRTLEEENKDDDDAIHFLQEEIVKACNIFDQSLKK
jgi:hypothetical protein